jgi:hypothetical protein
MTLQIATRRTDAHDRWHDVRKGREEALEPFVPLDDDNDDLARAVGATAAGEPVRSPNIGSAVV